jgi:glutamine cyclotransferase
MLRTLLVLATVSIVLAGCDGVTTDPDPIEPQTVGIVVASQGQFGADDGGVALFRLDGTVASRYDGLFVQSATLEGERLFVTTLNSVDVLEARTLVRTARFADIPNPRYLAFDDGRAFVTSLYTNPQTFGDGAVTRLDLASNQAGPTRIIGGNPDGIARVGSRVFVANYDFGAGNTITVLDADSMQEVQRVTVDCDGPRSLFNDQQRLVVVCTGNAFGDPATDGAFLVLDGVTGGQLVHAALPTTLGAASLGQLAAHVPEDRDVYAIDSDSRRVYRFDAASATLAATLAVGGAELNGVNYDPRREYLYLARLNPTNPFTAQGTLTVHTRQGVLVDTFGGAGVVPGHVAILALVEE